MRLIRMTLQPGLEKVNILRLSVTDMLVLMSKEILTVNVALIPTI